MRVTSWLAIGAVLLAGGEAAAQVIGSNIAMPGNPLGSNSRTLGSGVRSGKSSNLFSTSAGGQLSTAGARSGLPQPGNSAAPGMAPTGQGNWYIQRRHGLGSFVGTDTGDEPGFVGAQQSLEAASESAASALNTLGSLGLRSSLLLNRPMLPRKTTDLYYPRVEVGFTPPPRDTQAVSAELTRLVRATRSLRSTSPIEVSVEGQTATIRGGVASARDRILVERMVLFEPGIAVVRNLLTLPAPLPAPPPPSPPPSTPQK